MKKTVLIVAILLLTMGAYAQQAGIHYIKFFHVGEKILPVHTLAISYQIGAIPRGEDETTIDTLSIKYVRTDEDSYKVLESYIKKTDFRIGVRAGRLEFGTFKVIRDGRHFYLPDFACTSYFKKMVEYLRKKNCDTELIHAIVNNYPWVFNP